MLLSLPTSYCGSNVTLDDGRQIPSINVSLNENKKSNSIALLDYLKSCYEIVDDFQIIGSPYFLSEYSNILRVTIGPARTNTIFLGSDPIEKRVIKVSKTSQEDLICDIFVNFV